MKKLTRTAAASALIIAALGITTGTANAHTDIRSDIAVSTVAVPARPDQQRRLRHLLDRALSDVKTELLIAVGFTAIAMTVELVASAGLAALGPDEATAAVGTASGAAAVTRTAKTVCRAFASAADPAVFGALPAEVGAGTVSDPKGRRQIQIDVVVLAAAEPNRPRRVLSLGEAKSGERMGIRHVEKLRRARDLLADKGFDTTGTILTCYSAAGFNKDLLPSDDVAMIGLDRIYARS